MKVKCLTTEPSMQLLSTLFGNTDTASPLVPSPCRALSSRTDIPCSTNQTRTENLAINCSQGVLSCTPSLYRQMLVFAFYLNRSRSRATGVLSGPSVFSPPEGDLLRAIAATGERRRARLRRLGQRGCACGGGIWLGLRSDYRYPPASGGVVPQAQDHAHADAAQHPVPDAGLAVQIVRQHRGQGQANAPKGDYRDQRGGEGVPRPVDDAISHEQILLGAGLTVEASLFPTASIRGRWRGRTRDRKPPGSF